MTLKGLIIRMNNSLFKPPNIKPVCEKKSCIVCKYSTIAATRCYVNRGPKKPLLTGLAAIRG